MFSRSFLRRIFVKMGDAFVRSKAIAKPVVAGSTDNNAYRKDNFPFAQSNHMVVARLILRRAGLPTVTRAALLALVMLAPVRPANAQSASSSRVTAVASARVVILPSNVRLAAGQLQTSFDSTQPSEPRPAGVTVRDRHCERARVNSAGTARTPACTLRIYDLP